MHNFLNDWLGLWWWLWRLLLGLNLYDLLNNLDLSRVWFDLSAFAFKLLDQLRYLELLLFLISKKEIYHSFQISKVKLEN